MERIARLVVVFGALTLMAAHLVNSRAWSGMPIAAGGLFVTFVALAWFDRRAIGLVLVASCLMPTLVWLALGTYSVHFWILWVASLLGALLPDLLTSGWQSPPRWRVPLMLIALAVVVGAPIVIAREIDFNPALLGPVPASVLSGLPWFSVEWVLLVSVTTLVGVLWFDWLLGTRVSFDTTIIAPLALSIGACSLVAMYQMLVDVTFLNETVYGARGRAAGTVFDGNVAGVLAAAGLGLAAYLAEHPDRRRSAWLLLVPVCGTAVWATGSRTAFAAALVIALVSGVSWWRRHRRTGRAPDRRLVAAVAVLVLAAWAAVSTLETTTVGPFERFLRMMPGGRPGRSLASTASELWRRNGYGAASTHLIGTYPLTGVGIGGFHLFGPGLTPTGRLPPDNAQNWLRHQLVEVGLLGGVGWLLFAITFGFHVVRTWRKGDGRLDHLRGVVVAFAVISLVGMPTQEIVAAVTFWTVAAALGRMAVVSEPAPLGRTAIALVLLVTVAFCAATWHEARTSLRLPARARAQGFPFSYGLYDPEPDGAGGTVRWAARRATALVDVHGPFLRIALRAPLPDVARDPVDVQAWFEGRQIIDARVSSGAPVEATVRVPVGMRQAILDIQVSRAVRPRDLGGSSDDRELAALVSWRSTKGP